MISKRRPTVQLTLFLQAFYAVWTLRATVFYSVDESIASPLWQAAYATLLKLVVWIVPAAVFAWLLRKERPAAYLGLSRWPGARSWLLSLIVTGGFLLAEVVVELVAGRKSFSLAGLASLPLTLWVLQLVLSPLVEEVLFRGFILKELLALLPRFAASLLNSLLFAGIHLPYWLSHDGMTVVLVNKIAGVFAFSLVACWLYAKSNSIWPSTIVHIANNVLSYALVASA